MSNTSTSECLTPAQLMLTNCLRQDVSECVQADDASWKACVDLAIEQCVAPTLYSVVRCKDWSASVPASELQRLRWCGLDNNARNQRISQELTSLLTAANDNDIRVLVLKGCHLAHSYYSGAGLRFMGDYDVLVDSSHLDAMERIAESLGYEAQFDPDTDLVHHLPPLQIPGGIAPIEIHWTIVDPKYKDRIRLNDLWDRAVSIQINNVPALGMCSEDLLLYLCYHCGHHHLFTTGLRTLCDVVQILDRHSRLSEDAASDFDWEAFCDRSEEWGWNNAVFLNLQIASDMLKANVPTAVLDRLRPENCTDEVVAMARSYVFLKEQDAAQDIFENHVRVSGAGWVGRTIKGVPRRLFPPVRFLQTKYDLQNGGWKTAMHYPRHWFSVIATALSRRTVKLQPDQRRETRQKLLSFLDQVCDGNSVS